MKKYKNQVEENEQYRIGRNEGERAAGLQRNGTPRGIAIAEVETGSIAEELGIEAGAQLIQINNAPARDSIQLRNADTSEQLTITILHRNGQPEEFDIEKDAFEPLGIGIDAELFDGVSRCVNKCPFCFVDQLPPRVKATQSGKKNLRRTLYVRDDDYRLSFLHGHYITLTNLKDADYDRIISEKLSPLYVSVHATDPATRVRMVGNRHGGAIMERLRYLIEHGIQINAQIVLCPGFNDREQLDRSIADLMTLWPGVESLAVVPVGLTKFMPAERNLRTVQADEARHVLRQLKPHQQIAVAKFGSRFVYASDEMYLLAGEKLPGAACYDGFPQYANGVGMIRSFQDDIAKLRRRAIRSHSTLRTPHSALPKITLVTGALAAPVLRELADVLNAKSYASAEVVEIRNTFWGGNVACAGLLMGEEILANLRGRDCGDCVFLPPDAVDNQGRMLDDITLAEMSAQLHTSVRCDATGPLQLAQVLPKM